MEFNLITFTTYKDNSLQLRLEVEEFIPKIYDITSFHDSFILHPFNHKITAINIDSDACFTLKRFDPEGYERMLSLLLQIKPCKVYINLPTKYDEQIPVLAEVMEHVIYPDIYELQLYCLYNHIVWRNAQAIKLIFLDLISRTQISQVYPNNNYTYPRDGEAEIWMNCLIDAAKSPLETRIYPILSNTKSASKR